jgi:[acyl-carrier-protein] S-malonyltransferase
MTTAIVFPGQGSQAPRMAAGWVDHPAWDLVRRAETVLDRPLRHFLLDADSAPTDTRDVQLCVVLTSLIGWQAARPLLGEPTLFAGHSLGQVTALAAAGVLDFDEVVRLVERRGATTAAACRQRAGGMVAVLGLPIEQVTWACAAAPGQCWVANDNAPGQAVLGGTTAGLARVVARARELGARKVPPLQVEGPFHTPLMLPAVRGFAAFLRRLDYAAAAAPVLSNTDVAMVGSGSWSWRLSEHLIAPVRWRESQLLMARLGIERIVEIGYGTTLTSIARRTVPELELVNVDGPAALAALGAATAAPAGVTVGAAR